MYYTELIPSWSIKIVDNLVAEAFFLNLSKPFGTVDQNIIFSLPAATGFRRKGCFSFFISLIFKYMLQFNSSFSQNYYLNDCRYVNVWP